MVPNAPPSYAIGKEFQPLILSTLPMHGVQVKRERDSRGVHFLVCKPMKNVQGLTVTIGCSKYVCRYIVKFD